MVINLFALTYPLKVRALTKMNKPMENIIYPHCDSIGLHLKIITIVLLIISNSSTSN